jgi:hypothetical protein
MAQYNLTPELYLQAVRVAGRRVFWILGLIISSFLLLTAFLNSYREDDIDLSVFIPVAGFACFWFFGLPLLQRWKIRRIYRQQKSLHEPITLTLGEDELTWTAPSGSSRIRWSDLYRWKGNDSLTILYESQAVMRVIPHECLSSDEIHLLKRKLLNVRKGWR